MKDRFLSILSALIIAFYFGSTVSAEDLPYEVISTSWGEFDSAKIRSDGDVAVVNAYDGVENGSLLRFKEAGQPLKTLATGPGEQVDLIGFLPSGEIAAIVSPFSSDVVDFSFVAIDPQTEARRTLALDINDIFSIESVSLHVNDNGLSAIVYPSSLDNRTHVTFIDSDLSKTDYFLDGVAVTSGLNFLNSDGKLFLAFEGADQSDTYRTVTVDGTTTNLGSSIFGVPASTVTRYATGIGDTIGAVVQNSDATSLSYITLDTKTMSVTQRNGILPGGAVPSFESTFVSTVLTVDPAASLVTRASSIGFSDTFYLGTSPVRVNLDGTIDHLNCFFNPLAGHLTDFLSYSAEGIALALLRGVDSETSLVSVDTRDIASLSNHCLNVAPKLTKTCRGNFRTKHLKNDGYLVATNTKDPSNRCFANLAFSDVQGPVAQSQVYLRKNGTKQVQKVKTDANGRARVNLTRVLKDRRACGWSIFLEDIGKYQTNGIVVFREQAPQCHRE